jgi:hypothetical protein
MISRQKEASEVTVQACLLLLYKVVNRADRWATEEGQRETAASREEAAAFQPWHWTWRASSS